jgi:hypothetical protein
MGVGLRCSARSERKAARERPPPVAIAPARCAAVLGYVALFAFFACGFGFTALNYR